MKRRFQHNTDTLVDATDPAPPGLMPDEATIHARAGTRRMRLHAMRSKTGVVANILPSSYLVWLIWDDVPHGALLAWWMTLLILIGLNWHRKHRFLAGQDTSAPAVWIRHEIALSTILGLTWGAPGGWVVSTPQIVLNVGVILIAVSSFAVISMMYYPRAVVGFVLALWVVPSISLILSGDPKLQALVPGILILLITLNFYLWESTRQLLRGVSNQVRATLYSKALSQALTRIQRLADRDDLTDLPNRRAGMRALASAWNSLDPNADSVAILMLDIDHFKSINDNHGHSTGDAVLVIAGQRLARAMRPRDEIARIGGEEFLVIARGAEPAVVAQRLLHAIACQPIETDGLTLRVTASAGYATLADYRTEQQAMSAADAALFEAKRGGRNRAVAARRPGRT